MDESIVASEWRENADDSLDTIKAIAFGRFLVSLFKTMRFVFGLLPAGRFILLAIAVFSLLETWLDKKELSVQTVSDAFVESGLTAFFQESLNAVESELTAKADEIHQATLVLLDSVHSARGDLDVAVGRLQTSVASLGTISTQVSGDLFFEVEAIRNSLGGLLEDQLIPSSNLLSNLEVFFVPNFGGVEAFLRGLMARINTLME